MMLHSILTQQQKSERRNSFPVPNDIFALELLPGELAAYLYTGALRESKDASVLAQLQNHW